VVGVRLSLAAITYQPNDLTTHMHGHHEANMGLAGVYSLGRELRALALSHTALRCTA
jgi:hypothetical protein